MRDALGIGGFAVVGDPPSPSPSEHAVLVAIALVEDLEYAEIREVCMVSRHILPFDCSEEGLDFGVIFRLLESLHKRPDDVEEGALGLCLEVQALALGVVEVVGELDRVLAKR